MGIERLISPHTAIKMFIISLSLAILSNFYIGYKDSAFMCLCISFVGTLLTVHIPENNFYRERAHFIKSIGRIALASAIVLMIASIIILPTW